MYPAMWAFHCMTLISVRASTQQKAWALIFVSVQCLIGRNLMIFDLGMIRLLSELTQVHRASISLVKVDLECVKNDISADHSRTVGHGFENVLIRPSQIP